MCVNDVENRTLTESLKSVMLVLLWIAFLVSKVWGPPTTNCSEEPHSFLLLTYLMFYKSRLEYLMGKYIGFNLIIYR